MFQVARKGAFYRTEEVAEIYGLNIGEVLKAADFPRYGLHYDQLPYYGPLSTVVGQELIVSDEGQALRHSTDAPLLSPRQIKDELAMLEACEICFCPMDFIRQMYYDIYEQGAIYSILHLP
jgi:hypothetical protein